MNNEVVNDNIKTKKNNRKNKISFQKVFNFISFLFILICIIFYGTRFLKLYIENNKIEEINSISKTVKEVNEKNSNFKYINNEYYFRGKDVNNYVKYSNLLWRIVKINSDNTLTMVLDNDITSLAYGINTKYEKSPINEWLNKTDEEYSGVFQNNLNNSVKYLSNTNTCIDKVDNTKNVGCDNNLSDTYITIPSLYDYVNTGGKDGFMNNEESFYLTNQNSDGVSWYINADGNLSKNDGNSIMGIKPMVTIKNTIVKKDGDGTKDSPYTFEEESSLFGSYVKLGNDIWRIYSVEENNIKLSLNDYLELNGEEVKYAYSNKGYYHDDTNYGSLAYYLKNTYINSLSYKSILEETKFSNGIYNEDNNYDYKEVLSTKVLTMVSTLSIGDAILNPIITSYFLSTGNMKTGKNVYVMQNNFELDLKPCTTKLKVVPTISIKKDILINGDGTKENPLGVK